MSSVAKLAAATAGLALSTATVLAANMPVKAPVRPVPPSVVGVVTGWSGFYAGVHGGYGFADTDTDTTHAPSQALFNAAPFSQSGHTQGLLAGAQAGYNMQSGEYVYGVEVDWSHSWMKGSSLTRPLQTFAGAPVPGSSQFSHADLDWFATARLRFGMIAGERALIYATGGLAVAKVDYSVVTDYAGGPTTRYSGSTSDTRYGWTVGGGVEMGFAANWSVKAEYLYFDLGSDTVTANPAAPNPPFQVRTEHSTQGHIARLGVNYRFGDTAVVSRY